VLVDLGITVYETSDSVVSLSRRKMHAVFLPRGLLCMTRAKLNKGWKLIFTCYFN
jgi:hypothetical protein